MPVSRQNRLSRRRLERAVRPIRRTKISSARTPYFQGGAPPVRASRRLYPLRFLGNRDRSASHDQKHHRDQGDRPERHHAEIELLLIDPESAKGCENNAEKRQQRRLFPSE